MEARSVVRARPTPLCRRRAAWPGSTHAHRQIRSTSRRPARDRRAPDRSDLRAPSSGRGRSRSAVSTTLVAWVPGPWPGWPRRPTGGQGPVPAPPTDRAGAGPGPGHRFPAGPRAPLPDPGSGTNALPPGTGSCCRSWAPASLAARLARPELHGGSQEITCLILGGAGSGTSPGYLVLPAPSRPEEPTGRGAARPG